jgi:hypothetical protein
VRRYPGSLVRAIPPLSPLVLQPHPTQTFSPRRLPIWGPGCARPPDQQQRRKSRRKAPVAWKEGRKEGRKERLPFVRSFASAVGNHSWNSCLLTRRVERLRLQMDDLLNMFANISTDDHNTLIQQFRLFICIFSSTHPTSPHFTSHHRTLTQQSVADRPADIQFFFRKQQLEC